MKDALQQGMTAFKAAHFDEAERCFGMALEADPDNIAARSFHGQALCRLGRVADGTAQLREAAADLIDLARDGEDIAHALELVGHLQQVGDFDGALPLAREAAAVAPSNAHAQRLLATAASMTNQRDDALQAGAAALALAPSQPMLNVLMGSLEADSGRLDDAAARLEAALAAGLPQREAFRAHKEVARVRDRQGRYAEVFPHLDAAAAIGPTLPEYAAQSKSLLTNMLGTSRLGFDRASMSRWAGAALPRQTRAPVFLIGFFRSGTTLTQAVLDAHPGVHVTDEVPFIAAVHRELHRLDPAPGDTPAKLRRLGPAGVAALREFYWQQVQGRLGSALAEDQVLVDKFTLNTVDVGLIHTLFPDAKLLFVKRDPRDVCLSCYQQLMPPSAATARLLTLRGTAAFYDEVLNWWTYIRPALTMPWLEFSYEDAVVDFETTFRRVFGFLGLPWHPAVASFHERAAGRVIYSPSRQQVSQPLYASSVGRWRHYAAEMAAVEDVLRPWVTALGYET